MWPALDQFPYESRLWFYGGCVYFKRGMVAIAAQTFQRAIDLDDSPHIYSNLGACYRRLNMHDEGIHVLKTALERDPNYAPTLTNLGSMFVNEGNPTEGIPYLERAVEIGGEPGAAWNLSLLYLEAGRFVEGFDLYRQSVSFHRQTRAYGSREANIPEPVMMTPEHFATVKASGTRPLVIMWMEQGIGDELMFGTMLNDAIEDFDIILECHPRLERLHRNSTWAKRLEAEGRPIRLYPTRKEEWIQWPITDKVIADYKMPVGDLACYYRKDLQSFKDSWNKHGPTYRANPSESSRYSGRLQALAGNRPVIGLATRGGVMQTARTYRTIRLAEIDRLMTETDALFVSLDYDDMLGIASYIEEKYGPDRYRWFPSIVHHYDYEHTAALAKACDLNVTVCQSVAHLSASMGIPTRVLTPKRCAWRYASTEDRLWYWYPSTDVRLCRQDDPSSWDRPLSDVIADINALSKRNREAA